MSLQCEGIHSCTVSALCKFSMAGGDHTQISIGNTADALATTDLLSYVRFAFISLALTVLPLGQISFFSHQPTWTSWTTKLRA